MAAAARSDRYTMGITFCLILIGIASGARAQSASIASEIANQYSSATVFIVVDANSSDGGRTTVYGTGVLISNEGYVVTSSRLFQSKDGSLLTNVKVRGSLGSSFEISAPVGLIFPLQQVTQNREIQMALLQLPHYPQSYNFVHFCRNTSVQAGENIHVLSFPNGQALSISSGVIGSKDGPNGMWTVSIPVPEGSAGGPVFDGTGHVIGTLQGTTNNQGFGYVVPMNLLSDLLLAGMASIDDCASSPGREFPEIPCKPKIIEYDIDEIKSDHPSFTTDSRALTKVFPALPGYSIEEVQWIAASIQKANKPTIQIIENKSFIKFESALTSGPFFDQWRGWISGKIVSTQKPLSCSP